MPGSAAKLCIAVIHAATLPRSVACRVEVLLMESAYTYTFVVSLFRTAHAGTEYRWSRV